MKKIISIILIGVLIFQSTTISLNAAEAETPSRKEEVVYANLDNTGNPMGLYVVNIIKDKNILDYGEYSQITNLTTEDELTYQNGKVTGATTEEQLFYEGVLKQSELPWKISLSYKLEGSMCSAEELAGADGALCIKLSIKENKQMTEKFFSHYALQVTLKLDTNKCQNIKSDEATVANVGDIKQYTYTIMPGKEKEIELTADVTDFEMESISLNGVTLNLGINADTLDTNLLDGEISKLQDSVKKLDDGSQKINDGMKHLNRGADQMKSGMKTIKEALATLDKESGTLTKGSGKVKKALGQIENALKGVSLSTAQLSKLSSSSTQIKNGIDSLVGGLNTMSGSVDDYYAALKNKNVEVSSLLTKNDETIRQLSTTVEGMKQQYQTLVSLGYGQAEEAIALQNNIQTFSSIINLLTADREVLAGSNQLISGIGTALNKTTGPLMSGALNLQTNYAAFNSSIQQLVKSLTTLSTSMTECKKAIHNINVQYTILNKGIGQYTDSVGKVLKGCDKLYEGAYTLTSGTSKMYQATQKLAAKTGQFSEKTEGLDLTVQEKINDVLDSFTGGEFTPVSFVSEKNEKVDAVQFVMKTVGIEKPQKKEADTIEKEEIGFWGKLVSLFNF